MLSIGVNISIKIININKNDISKEEFVDLVEEHKLPLYRFEKCIYISNKKYLDITKSDIVISSI